MNLTERVEQLNRNSKVPLYHQLYEILRGYIITGKWPPDSLLPSEKELRESYGVSQITVRQALDNLVNDGLIIRQRGRGTFVAQPAIETSLTRIISFTEDMGQRGFSPGSRVTFAGLVDAPATIANKLQVAVGEELAQLHRLRFADGEPLSIERASLVHRFCPNVLEVDYEANSLRETLRDQFGIQMVRAKQSIRAYIASAEQAEMLSIKLASPLLGIERVSYSQHDQPMEYLQIYYRADRYVLHTELQG